MTYFNMLREKNSHLSEGELNKIIESKCPSSIPFVDEKMVVCQNQCGVENDWCKRHWNSEMVEDEKEFEIR